MPLPLDLRLLWYFKRTAEIGSLTKAAVELRTSQPALTRHIMRLEHELHATLLLRDQRGVTPTEAGALVLDKAENLLRLEQAMKDDIGALSRTIAGDVSLCMPSSMHWVVTAPMTSAVMPSCHRAALLGRPGLAANSSGVGFTSRRSLACR